MQKKNSPPHIIFFTGHMIDTAARKIPRFPPESEDLAREMIQQAVLKIARGAQKAGKEPIGISGGASGGDILFQEVCNVHGIKRTLYLALPKERYIELSVAPAGEKWVHRFNRLFKKSEHKLFQNNNQLKDTSNTEDEPSIWARANLWMLENATANAEKDFTLIALWNGEQGDGPGGTKDMVARAQARGAKVIHLDAKKLLQEEA